MEWKWNSRRSPWLIFHLIRVLVEFEKNARSKYLFWCWNNAPFLWNQDRYVSPPLFCWNPSSMRAIQITDLSQLTCVVALIVQCNDTCATTALCLSLSVYRGFHSLSGQFKKLISFRLLYPTIVERNQHRMTTDDKRWWWKMEYLRNDYKLQIAIITDNLVGR